VPRTAATALCAKAPASFSCLRRKARDRTECSNQVRIKRSGGRDGRGAFSGRFSLRRSTPARYARLRGTNAARKHSHVAVGKRKTRSMSEAKNHILRHIRVCARRALPWVEREIEHQPNGEWAYIGVSSGGSHRPAFWIAQLAPASAYPLRSPSDTHRRLNMNLRCVSGGATEGIPCRCR